MHLEHEPGDKLYLDFAGTKQHDVVSLTGEQREAEVFIASLEYSHDT
jgi:transposase